MNGAVYKLTSEEQQILENLPNAVGVFQSVDGKMMPVFLSGQFLKLFGYDSGEQAMEALRRDLYHDIHPDDAARIAERGYGFERDDTEYDVIYRNRNKYQPDYHIIHAVGRHAWKDGRRLSYFIYTDESRILNGEPEELQLSEPFSQTISLDNDLHRNQFDDLTGLPTVSQFLQTIPARILEIRREHRIPAILWMDYSGFREYETLNGFETGDALIRGLGWLIRGRFGVRNTARFNSDHFVACASTDNLECNIRSVFENVAKLNRGNSRPIAVGVYVMDCDDISLTSAIDRAKLACDSLKNPAHSSYTYFNQEMLVRAERKQYLLQNYQRAMAEGWIQVYYQPVMRTITGKLCGAEALCRWKDPVYGMISPGEFIPALEDEGRITDLDLFMFEQVCRDGWERIKAGMNIVPVSVNLSRKDFRKPDLVERIEGLAKEYKIPRELINLEITESAFIRHPERLSQYISRFHELGFQVWMDDFGTAYSSLGSLKDLNFDELKIDMSFLSTSTEKARNIITSVVDMAKKIGIQTLAEGVETCEQYEFLKQIGCEKVQGYYFGKPMDRASFSQHCRDRKIGEERLRWKNYYDALSRIDYQTDEPLCVIEDDGKTMRLLFANEAYKDVLSRDGINDIDSWIAEINTDNNPMHAFHRRYANEQLRKLKGPQVITYPSGDHYMELTGNVITHYEKYYIYAMNIRYIRLNTTSKDQQRAYYIQSIYYLCGDIAVCNLMDNTMYGLKSVNSAEPIGIGGESIDLMRAEKSYTEKFIYPPDQKRFHAFLNLKTLRTRMMEKKGQDLKGFFRSKMPDGEYYWMLHMCISIPGTDFYQVLLVTIPVDFNSEVRGLLLGDPDQSGEHGTYKETDESRITPALLWKNLEAYSDGMYFWKDVNRRFVGASRSFLNFYGFQSEDDIIGKTDEEMHWHVETEPFKNDEIDVLANGERVSLAKGKCIVRGKQRTILANKIPIYRDGKIIGLMGNFFDAENLYQLLDDGYQSESIDAVTDLLNTTGLSECFRDYLEALWTDNKEFSLVQIYIPEYEDFARRYGKEAGHTLLRSVGELLRKVFGRESTIGRLTGSYFTILIQDEDPKKLTEAQARFEEKISRLRKVGQWQCALTATIRVSVMNQTNASQEKYAKNLNHMWAGLSVYKPEA
ncbi:EAL domain-containing protein [Bilifractor sp. LCP19S3_H10]|uniref:EAL domain-containing protein n=1 Tax=Bilifractor sp. LCP19S3_H10 TaxID=3438736 RepID=UPI003F8E5DB1